MINFFRNKLFTVHQNGKQHVSEVFKYIGPGIIVTVGFIDPGNWAANLAAGASYGYELLWVVTLSTLSSSYCSIMWPIWGLSGGNA